MELLKFEDNIMELFYYLQTKVMPKPFIYTQPKMFVDDKFPESLMIWVCMSGKDKNAKIYIEVWDLFYFIFSFKSVDCMFCSIDLILRGAPMNRFP